MPPTVSVRPSLRRTAPVRASRIADPRLLLLVVGEQGAVTQRANALLQAGIGPAHRAVAGSSPLTQRPSEMQSTGPQSCTRPVGPPDVRHRGSVAADRTPSARPGPRSPPRHVQLVAGDGDADEVAWGVPSRIRQLHPELALAQTRAVGEPQRGDVAVDPEDHDPGGVAGEGFSRVKGGGGPVGQEVVVEDLTDTGEDPVQIGAPVRAEASLSSVARSSVSTAAARAHRSG